MIVTLLPRRTRGGRSIRDSEEERGPLAIWRQPYPPPSVTTLPLWLLTAFVATSRSASLTARSCRGEKKAALKVLAIGFSSPGRVLCRNNLDLDPQMLRFFFRFPENYFSLKMAERGTRTEERDFEFWPSRNIVSHLHTPQNTIPVFVLGNKMDIITLWFTVEGGQVEDGPTNHPCG